MRRKKSLRFWDTNRSCNLGQTTRACDSQQIKKKRSCLIVDLTVPADHKVKLKETKKRDKYLDLAKELKKLSNRKATVTPILIGMLGTVTKGLVQEQEDLKIRGRVNLFTNPSTRAGYDTRSIFKRTLTGLNSEFSFS